MRVILDICLPDALRDELESAAQQSHMPTRVWAAQQIEAELASRRLPKVSAARSGARISLEQAWERREVEAKLIL